MLNKTDNENNMATDLTRFVPLVVLFACNTSIVVIKVDSKSFMSLVIVEGTK